ncbi:hypothetical protein HpKG35_01130 [Helicobacter pylori]
MLENFKKAIFRVLCLGLLGGGLMASQTPKELFDQGKEILDFAVSGGGGTFRGDSLEAKKYYIQAKGYFEKACELNYAKGCVSLGGLYEGENLVIGEKNPRLKERLKKAVQYYSKACELQNSMGCSSLGDMHYIGESVVKNKKQAMEKFEKACELGYKQACKTVSYQTLCEQGVGETCEIVSLMVRCRLRGDLKACGMEYDKEKALGF